MTTPTPKRPPVLTEAQRVVAEFIHEHTPYDFDEFYWIRKGFRNMKPGAVARVIGSLRSAGLVRLYNPDGSRPGVLVIGTSWGGSGGYRFCELTPAGIAALGLSRKEKP